MLWQIQMQNPTWPPPAPPTKPIQHEQLLKLSCVSTLSFRRCSVRHGGLNWELVSLSIKSSIRWTPQKINFILLPPPPRRSPFDICVRRGRLTNPPSAGLAQLPGEITAVWLCDCVDACVIHIHNATALRVCMCTLAASDMLWCTSSWG